ncbi:MAG: TraR/DksA C4-type zinc finger protein [Patescibacteria group bacterium]|jgi:RNA polymerase-binding transcription factor DksA
MPITKTFLEKQRRTLLEEKGRLEERIARLREYPDYGFDEEDNVREISEFESNRSFETQMQYLLNKVNRALEAISDGTYGQCTKCSSAIEEGRLAIMPYAELCVSCNIENEIIR